MGAQYNLGEVERLITEAREDDARITPGPWVNGRVAGQCHMKHQHDAFHCSYDYRIDPGGGSISIAPNVTLVGYDETGEILSPRDAAGISRTRNNLGAMADQLEAARDEVRYWRAESERLVRAANLNQAAVDRMRPVFDAAVRWRNEKARMASHLWGLEDQSLYETAGKVDR